MNHNDDMATTFFEDGEQVTASVTIQRPAHEIYALWSGFAGLPQFVQGFELMVAGHGPIVDLQVNDKTRGSGPVKWQAEILKEEPGRMIAWRSVGTPAVPNAGSVTLRELPFARGTEVKVVIDYIPPKGDIVRWWSTSNATTPEAYLQLTLFRFRQLLETGEMATTMGQPSGREDGRDERGSQDEQHFASMETRS